MIFNPKPENNGIYNFPKAITPKLNVIARLEFVLIFLEDSLQKCIHYVKETPDINIWFFRNLRIYWSQFYSDYCYYLRVVHTSGNWNLSDNKSLQISGTLLIILAGLNNAVV